MEIEVTRKKFHDTCTLGELKVDGLFFCYTLEDVDRDLMQSDTPEYIKKVKVNGQTAIPYGRYEITVTYSNRFGKPLPLIMTVPGFEGIRVHSGNKSADTEGCLLVGDVMKEDEIQDSRKAFRRLFALIQSEVSKGKVYILITK
jgi:hypothetical protein